MKKLIQTLILLSFLPIAAIGQTIHITGTVTQDNVPAVNAYVYAVIYSQALPDTVGTAVTNIDGLYGMDLVADENDSLVYVFTDACPGVEESYFLADPENIVNLSCGEAGSDGQQLFIGATPISEDQLTWYFMNNFNTGVESYNWNIGGETYNTADVTHTFSESGSYLVVLIVHSLDGSIDSTGFYFSAGNPSTGGSGNCQALFFPVTDSIGDGSIYFVNSSLGSNLTYLWSFGDGTSSNEAYPSHTFSNDEVTYIVCLTIWSDNCEQQYCTGVSGGLDGSGLIVNGDKPEHDLAKSGSFDFIVIPAYSGPTGVSEALAPLDFRLYPNPSTGNVNVQLDIPASEKGVINITDLTGKIVAQKPVSGTGSLNTITLNMDKLADGTYLLQYKGTSISEVQKVILQR